jgi:hypothetical protein
LDSGKKSVKQEFVDSDSNSVIEIEEPKRDKKIDCIQLSDSKENEENVKNGSVAEDNSSPSYIGRNSDSEGSSAYFKKKDKQKPKRRLKKVGCSSRAAVGIKKRNKSEPKQSGSMEYKELPKDLDETSAKLACDWLEERGKEIVSVGDILTLRARRCLEKKVNLKTMTNPQNVDKVVSSLQLLMKLARENLEQIESFLSLNYKYWFKQVVKHSFSGTDAVVSNSNQQGNEDRNKKSITKHNQSKVDMSVSVNGVGGDDINMHSGIEKECDDNGIENGETGKEQSDISGACIFESVDVGTEPSRKRKLLQEGSDNDDREVVHSGEIEEDLQKSVKPDKKRKKLEDGLEMEVDTFADADVNSTGNDMQSECAVKQSGKPETDMEFEDVLEGKTVEDCCTDVTKDDGGTEIEKTGDRNQKLNGVSLRNEKDIVAENSVEFTSLLHETANELDQSETNYSGNGSTVYEVDKRSEKSFESLSTVRVQHRGEDLPAYDVSDIPNDIEKTVVCVEDTLQEDQPKKPDEEHNYTKLNAESETEPEENGGVAAVDEGSKSEENERVGENDSVSDVSTIEFLYGNEYEKCQHDEGEGNDKIEKLDCVESLADDSKRLLEENKTETEGESSEDIAITDTVGKDPLPAVGLVMEVSEEVKDFEVQKHVTGSEESNVEENKMDTCEEPEKYIEKEDETKKLESEHEKEESSDIGKLEVYDDMSICEGEEKDNEKDKVEVNEEHKISDRGELEMSYLSECEGKEKDDENKVEMNEDKKGGKGDVEEGTVDAVMYTEDCIRAKQALLEYSTDDEDSCAETSLRKKKKKEQSKNAKEKEDTVCKDTKPARKQRCGPKSRIQKGGGSTASSSALSATDVDSECSLQTYTKAGGGRRKKFRLKDTEAYKQDEKLGWKCTVCVQCLADEVFWKHYERYCSDGESESEKKAKDDKEIDR